MNIYKCEFSEFYFSVRHRLLHVGHFEISLNWLRCDCGQHF